MSADNGEYEKAKRFRKQFPRFNAAKWKLPVKAPEMKVAIGHKDEKVFLKFSAPTDWLAFSKADALALAENITKHASEI